MLKGYINICLEGEKVKVPKEIKLYCKHCKTHRTHKLKLFKAASVREVALGQRRYLAKHKSGYGGKSKYITFKKKQTKKPTFLATCSEANCGKKQYYIIAKRMKKIEFEQ